jgi:formiminotetrahydrofolate cyclodeaminase
MCRCGSPRSAHRSPSSPPGWPAHGHPNLHGDAITAALLAEAGARSACALVRINLSAAESDERLARVARLLAAMPSAGTAP